MYIRRHIPFLKTVFLYACTAFGGPQAHLGMMLRIFVKKRKDITEDELLEYNAFCQLLPGASSTQLLTTIAYKRGGIPLAILSCLIWILPASLLMSIFSFLITSTLFNNDANRILSLIHPMAIGFLLYTSVISYRQNVSNLITHSLMIAGAIAMVFLFKTPWVLPILLVTSGLATSFSKKRIPDESTIQKKEIKWRYLVLFIGLFILVGSISEYARKNNWSNRKMYNLIENNYRFGSIVFGGGDVLLPMMLDQYVERPTDHRIKKNNPGIIQINKTKLVQGYGILKAIPGPVFSFAAYIGGMALSAEGFFKHLFGCIIGAIFIFLPGILLLFFFLPIWNNVKKYAIFLRALEGIKAVTVGVLIATVFYLSHELFIENYKLSGLASIVTLSSTFLLLSFTKIPPPLIVIITLLGSVIFNL